MNLWEMMLKASEEEVELPETLEEFEKEIELYELINRD